ncbi:MAG: hypothetical protein R3229_18065 [Alphaproteobacteria bacterium]|nr:hypothetical protein [Alphaproteobacteria bacterium]
MMKSSTVFFLLFFIAVHISLAGAVMGQTPEENRAVTREQWLDRNAELFFRFDRNADGLLDREEAEALFDALDVDDDDLLERGEGVWPQFDRDNDGWIDLEEFLSAAPLTRREFLRRRENTFDTFDTDQDGRLSPREAPVRQYQIFRF